MAWNKALFLSAIMLCTVAFAAQKTAPSTPPKASLQNIKWYRDYHSGLHLAKLNKQPVLIKFTAAWCGWCKKMEQEVLNQPPVKAELKKFTCIKVDTEKDLNVAFAYSVRSLPRILVINTHDEIVGDWLGYREVDDFLALIKDIQQYTQVSMGTMKVPQIDAKAMSRPIAASQDPNAPANPSSLAERLGHRDPAIRQQAIEALRDQGGEGTLQAVDLLGHNYLGVRIAAWQALRKMKTTTLPFDPWASRGERIKAIEALRGQIE